MKNKNDWAKDIAPMDLQACDSQRICEAVRDKMNAEKGSVITMRKNKRIKPLVIAAAVAATAAVSMVSVNAATDGQLVERIRLFINGEEQDVNSSKLTAGVDSDGNTYYEYHADGTESEVSVELDGDLSDTDGASVNVQNEIDLGNAE